MAASLAQAPSRMPLPGFPPKYWTLRIGQSIPATTHSSERPSGFCTSIRSTPLTGYSFRPASTEQATGEAKETSWFLFPPTNVSSKPPRPKVSSPSTPKRKLKPTSTSSSDPEQNLRNAPSHQKPDQN